MVGSVAEWFKASDGSSEDSCSIPGLVTFLFLPLVVLISVLKLTPRCWCNVCPPYLLKKYMQQFVRPDSIILPSHCSSRHVRYSLQDFTPFLGRRFVQFRDRDWEPFPQVTLHDVHSDHSDKPAVKMSINRICLSLSDDSTSITKP